MNEVNILTLRLVKTFIMESADNTQLHLRVIRSMDDKLDRAYDELRAAKVREAVQPPMALEDNIYIPAPTPSIVKKNTKLRIMIIVISVALAGMGFWALIKYS